MTLQNEYQENYEVHPAFKFETNSLFLNEELLQSFNSAIGSSRTPINEGSIQKSKMILKQIFDNFKLQVNDDFQLLFFDELYSQILRYLENEFRFRLNLNKKFSSNNLSNALDNQAFFYSELSPGTLVKILEIANPYVEKFRMKAKSGLLKRSDLSINEGRVIAKISKQVSREFRRNGIFDAVSNYVGIEYASTGISLELSVEGSTWWKNTISGVESPATMYAHLDESIYAPKAIVYLSHVRNDNGPTSGYPGVYDELRNNTLQDIVGRVVGEVGNIPNSKLAEYYSKSYHQSMGSERFREHFMLLPKSLRFNSHFGWDILRGSNFESLIAMREDTMLGKPGKFIVFDGSRLLHRGGLIEHGERLVLQVVFIPKPTIMEFLLKFSRRVINRLKSIL